MIPNKEDFLKELVLRNKEFKLTDNQLQRTALFAHILHRENAEQNLTRILGTKEFVDGHLVDVMELLNGDSLGQKVLDIGSGSGVPGLLAAAIDESSREWHLAESEQSKAEYLVRAAAEIGLKQVFVYPARADQVVREINPDTVMARAVGSVEKIAAWIWDCSTWNNLVLFKSRGWEDEWKQAQLNKFGKKLTVTHVKDYSNDQRTRLLVTLTKK